MSWFSWLAPVYPEIKERLKAFHPRPFKLSPEEEQLVQAIRNMTKQRNRNNITRTQAYWEFFERNPELEWALLAHMVSRNAGWSMTDIRGDWCSRMLEEKEREDYFRFLERANWLIFQDAYPQLLLYAHCKEVNENAFHLLESFRVSTFMRVMWQDFWEHRNPERITISLIINEQNYIESRVLKKETYAAPILHDIKYYLEDWLNLCMIIFPSQKSTGIHLYGRQVHSFPELEDRIELGKQLYTLLFSKEVLPGVRAWCAMQPHTGSREDYWPRFFSSALSKNLDHPYVPRLENHAPPRLKIYSPSLLDVWSDVHHEPPGGQDWYQSADVAEALRPEKISIEEADWDYWKMLQRIESLVEIKQKLLH